MKFILKNKKLKNTVLFLIFCLLLVVVHIYYLLDNQHSFIAVVLLLIVATLLTIISKKNVYRELHEKERQFSSIITNLPGFVYRCKYDDEMTVIYISDRCQNITGYSPDDFINNHRISPSQIIVSEFLPILRLAVADAIIQRRSFTAEFMLQTKDGEYRWVHEQGCPVYAANGEVLFIEGYVEDVSERKLRELELLRSEEALSQSNKTYSQLFNGMDETVWVLDLEGKIIDTNSSVTGLLGYSSEEVLELVMTSIDVGLSAEDLKLMIKNMPDDKKQRFETIHRKKNGDLIPVEISSSIVNYRGQKCILSIGRDISIRKQMEAERLKYEEQQKELYDKLLVAKEKAEESDRLKMAFLANMSHEIRTPMNGILGFMELLKDSDLEASSRQEYIELVNISGQRLLTTINDIIEISKIETGQFKIRQEHVNIEEIMQYFHDFFIHETHHKGLKLIMNNQVTGAAANVITDRHKLDSILTNLLKNAIKFTSQGYIEFGAYLENGSIVFYVSDTGRGIPADRLDAIFERFVQAEINATRAHEGSGLGLAIARAYAEALNGNISVISEPWKGSKFTVMLPHINQHTSYRKNEVIEAPAVKPAGAVNLLIAEDDDISFRFLEKTLNSLNYNLVRVTSGMEAVNAVKSNPDFHLILMDIKMPDMDGFQATTQIRTFNTAIPIIAQTAYALHDDRKKALEAGCTGYISKPIRKDELLSLINKHTS